MKSLIDIARGAVCTHGAARFCPDALVLTDATTLQRLGRRRSMPDVDHRFQERLREMQERFERELASSAERLETRVKDRLDEARKEIERKLHRR